jgi:hypothetical protein
LRAEPFRPDADFAVLAFVAFFADLLFAVFAMADYSVLPRPNQDSTREVPRERRARYGSSVQV